ncbi:YqaA family protein [Aureivirga marina]|uniref:YqaA family protein n=1 Tax=Aureivirga marina TaxID=1182451 RepID=UPI0018CAC590|nr:short-chain dehydrogenase [Aureivirga marina]
MRFLKLYYEYLKRTGLFTFLRKNLKSLLIVVGIVVGIFFIIEKFVITMKEIFQLIVDNVPDTFVYVIFTASETILGLIPPDLFIMWSKTQGESIGVNPWLLVGVLATLSYLGGVIAYGIGMKIEHIPKIHYWVTNKYSDLFTNLKKWGGFFIVIAALLPIPFSMVTLISGITGYSFRWLLILGLFRYVRFFVYAIFLFLAV